MDLQQALLLIGAVIVIAIAVSSYDKARLHKREQFRKARQAQAGQDAVAPQLDINPGPPSDIERRSLRADDATTQASAGHESPIYRELESVEQVATQPFSVAPSVAPRKGASTRELPQVDFEALFPVGQNQGPNLAIDFIVYLPGRGPILRDVALGIYKQHEYLLEKPRQLYGLRYLSGAWSVLERDADDAQYSDLALALQLVDSKGPVDESELNAFMQLALKLADVFHRPTRLPVTVEHALERAHELQRFAEKYDVIASINIVADNGHPFSGPAIEQAAKCCGMQFGVMNIFHMKSDNAAGCRHLFSMASLYDPGAFDPKELDSFHTGGLTLFMTVPCVHDPVRVFGKMIDTASRLSQALGGRLIDQDKRPLSNNGVAAIERQIKQIAADISAHGIIPGSETALRFFGQ